MRAVALCVLLASCAPNSPPSPASVATGVEAGPSNTYIDWNLVPDTCGYKALVSFVGRPKSQLPAKPAGAVWRITCTNCPVTMDYSPARLTILFDEKTQVVKELKCG